MNKDIPQQIFKVIRETRYLYRLSVTEEEVQDGWVRIIMCELDYPEHEEALAATKLEFHMRMELMGIQYINFDKAIDAINIHANKSKIGRVN